MKQALLVVAVLASVLAFPFSFTVLLVVLVAPLVPLVPLIAGIFADTLYWSPSLSSIPVTCYGLLATGIAYLVHSRIKTSIIFK